MAFNPSNHIPLSKALGANAFPIDGKYMYFTNGANGIYAYRPFANVAEVKAYFPQQFRKTEQGSPLAFEILVNSGGTISLDGGSITGGSNSVWWWRNGFTDADLEIKGGTDEQTFTNSDLTNDGGGGATLAFTLPIGKTILGIRNNVTGESYPDLSVNAGNYGGGVISGFRDNSVAQQIIIKLG